jgi:precorrin-2/cobalt-factor-2 C20-methyltransferase
MADRQAMTGTLYGLGVGPGDPELITLKAARILAQVPVVAFLQTATVTAWPGASPQASFPKPPNSSLSSCRCAPSAPPAGQPTLPPLRRHRRPPRRRPDVAVLCEGDPFLYGSFMYLHERLHERYSIEVVPGVSSLTAAAAALGRPLAARNDILAVIPAPSTSPGCATRSPPPKPSPSSRSAAISTRCAPCCASST